MGSCFCECSMPGLVAFSLIILWWLFILEEETRWLPQLAAAADRIRAVQGIRKDHRQCEGSPHLCCDQETPAHALSCPEPSSRCWLTITALWSSTAAASALSKGAMSLQHSLSFSRDHRSLSHTVLIFKIKSRRAQKLFLSKRMHQETPEL